MIGLGGRSLLVVGGGSGIGFAAARLAAEAGALVLVADINEQAASSVSAISGKAAFIACDAGDPESAAAAVTATVARYGRLDGLLITVGGAHPAAIEEQTLDGWSTEISFNLTSTFVVCRAAV